MLASAFVASCSNDPVEDLTPETPASYITVKAVADAPEQTRASFEDSEGYPVSWGDEENFKVVEVQLDGSGSRTAAKAATQVSNYEKVGNIANFDFTVETTEAEQYQYYAILPAPKSGSNQSEKYIHITIPEEQVQTTTVDENAVVLLGKTEPVSVQGGEGSLHFTFEHITGYGKMTLTNLNLDEGKTVGKVVFTADNKITSGSGNYKYTFDGAEFTDAGSNSVKVDVSALEIDSKKAAEGFTVWFGVAPLANITEFSVEVYDSKNILIAKRSISDIPSDKALAFNAAQISKFSVDMRSAEYPESTTIADGKYVILAQKGNSYVAAGAVSTTSTKYLTITDFTGYTGNEEFVIADPSLVWTITNTDENTYTVQYGESGYLYYSSSNGSNSAALNSNKEELLITLNNDSSAYTIRYGNDRTLRFNTDRFAFYTSNTGTADLYIIPAKEAPVITVEEVLNIPAEETEDTLTATVTNYTGNITVEVSENEDSYVECNWLDAEWSDGGVYYYAMENTSETARTAYITIKASNSEGEASKTITVNQAGVGGEVVEAKEYKETFEGMSDATSYSSTSTTSSATGVTWTTISCMINGAIDQNNFQYGKCFTLGDKSNNVNSSVTSSVLPEGISELSFAYTANGVKTLVVEVLVSNSPIFTQTISTSNSSTATQVTYTIENAPANAVIRFTNQTGKRISIGNLSWKSATGNTGGGTTTPGGDGEENNGEEKTTTVTFADYSISNLNTTPIEKEGVTLTFDKGSNTSSNSMISGSEARIYKGSNMTVSVTGTISKIEVKGSTGANAPTNFSTNVGTYDTQTNAANCVWTGSAQSVTFNASGAQTRVNTLVVTYTE